ncbi:NAD(P)/FAD-dependent oxidoreductase [Synechococcus elongatus]|uniref:FAD-dependent oxidoreductase n=1 Tax=Synechococcus elongatus PCC 11801 TaxID=2219813 RepID=A0AAN1UUQ8_SYNEL|nr:FAD-dependent oxidoreductase [Synechococcus elongatus]AZB72887.1 FAD-binding oxidoreductase [Synechococcus elongatus PCC 11801]
MSKQRLIIIGAGAIGACLAYELSADSRYQITVFDQAAGPATGATGAALGVLIGVLCQRTKGRFWQLRQRTLARYQSLIPELEAAIGQPIPGHEGLLKLVTDPTEREGWEQLQAIRRQQGYELELWDPSELRDRVPSIAAEQFALAVWSPYDRQINPTALTLALVKAAQQRGVEFCFNTPVQTLQRNGDRGLSVEGRPCDWLILSAGLGSTAIAQQLGLDLPMQPVLGQALRLRWPNNRLPQQVMTAEDIHLVPLTDRELWLGATVEMPPDQTAIAPQAEYLETLRSRAVQFWPDLQQAEVLQAWQGYRPRPLGRPAPVIECLTDWPNVIVATAHYRNGLLLAPVTAAIVQELLAAAVPPSTAAMI